MTYLPQPQFVAPIRRRVLRFPMNEPCELQSLDSTFEPSAADLDMVTSIANEELVYRMIFQKRLNGQPYPRERARNFFIWACEGWRKNEWFVFVVRDAHNHILAAIDIKSNDLEGAEIGYWATAKQPGVMTNTVLQLTDIAREAGYRKLYALVRPDNDRSAGVLRRAGFTDAGNETRDETVYLKFAKTL
ncbi:MAG TPA: GNAT family N-acetyltransferase [Ktedonosporobacter sp.]|nr:GNAT family N-acetyltransferase [Ktedonosporobacter sp.]